MNARTREEWEQLKVQRQATAVADNILHEEARELRRSVPDARMIIDGGDLAGYPSYDFPSETLLLTGPAKMLMLHRISCLVERMMLESPKGFNDRPVLDAVKCDRLFAFMLKSFQPSELAIWVKDISLRSGVSFVMIPETEIRTTFLKTISPYVRGFIG